MCYNVSIALGCHIDPDNFDLNPIQKEERRRCWAGLMMLHMIQSTVLGNPAPSWRVINDVQLPADANDVDITTYGIQNIASGPTQMSYLLFKFSLYDITSKICNEIFNEKPPSRQTIDSLDHEICVVQEAWDRRYLSDSIHCPLSTHHSVHLNILYGYSHQLFLLLHRPFFAQSLHGLDTPNESQIRCISSAEALLDIHRMFYETPSFRPYKWYKNGLGSFHAFHAAAVLAVALLQPIYSPQHDKFRRILEDTLRRFETSASRSLICSKSARILKILLLVHSI
jgi:hypothetical protein